MAKKSHLVRLVCWKNDRTSEIVPELESAGLTVDATEVDPAALKAIGHTPPDAVVIDLARLPAQGRDVGLAVRTRKSSRHVPLVFLDGAPEKVDRTKKQLPDAVYTVLSELGPAVIGAIDNPLKNPVVPSSNLAGYSGTPLPKKLGIKPDSVVALEAAPEGFRKTLGKLPPGATITEGSDPSALVTLWFVLNQSEFESSIDGMAASVGDGRLWICWPKKASGVTTDITQNEIRARGLATGLVDFKICAVDATWSGLCFTRRKK